MRRRKRWLWLAVAVVAVAGIGVALLPREPDLLARAQRITSVLPPNANRPSLENQHAWISDHELLLLSLNMQGGGSRFARYNLDSHSQTSLDALAAQYRRDTHQWGQFSLSPDGRRVLWSNGPFLDSESDSPYRKFCVAALDGGKTTVWKMPPGRGGVGYWMPDSEHWLSLDYHSPSISTDRLDADRRDVADAAKPRRIEISSVQGAAIPNLGWVQVLSKERMLSTNAIGERDHVKTVFFHEWQLGTELTQTKEWKVNLPDTLSNATKNTFVGYSVSPDGRRIVWTFHHLRVNLLSHFLRRFLPAVKEQKYMISLWTSDLYGTNMREVGAVDVTERGGENAGEPGDVQWTPDSKRLSFVYDSAIYTVPVDSL